MLTEIRDSFRSWLNVIFWVILIASVLGGIHFGLTEGQILLLPIDGEEHKVLGALLFGFLGFLIGYIFLVICFGWIATLLNIDENVQKTTKVIEDLDEKIKKLTAAITDSAENKRSPSVSSTAGMHTFNDLNLDLEPILLEPDLDDGLSDDLKVNFDDLGADINDDINLDLDDGLSDDLNVNFNGLGDDVNADFELNDGLDFNIPIKEATDENTRPIKKMQPHESAITAFDKTIAVIGDASISAVNFAHAKTKLETAMAGLYKRLLDPVARDKFAKMLNRTGFEMLIETGNESPNANAHKSMIIGVDYLLAHDAEPTIAIAIRDKVHKDNAFAN
jgi:hypothetical protein